MVPWFKFTKKIDLLSFTSYLCSYHGACHCSAPWSTTRWPCPRSRQRHRPLKREAEPSGDLIKLILPIQNRRMKFQYTYFHMLILIFTLPFLIDLVRPYNRIPGLGSFRGEIFTLPWRRKSIKNNYLVIAILKNQKERLNLYIKIMWFEKPVSLVHLLSYTIFAKQGSIISIHKRRRAIGPMK